MAGGLAGCPRGFSKRLGITAVLLWSLAVPMAASETSARTIAELRRQIESILKDTRTPGASVAIVRRGGPEWVGGLGVADVATGRPATADTLFRIGSVSKGFVALAVLLLADQGRLSLDDPVRKLAPEVFFKNQWEASDPVRVVHLLEHTTGWDDMHLRQMAQDSPGISLRAALDYDSGSRISRWRPGTRMAYSNSGPPVAAFIVEKLARQPFEEFVEQHLFRPIGMKTATWFEPSHGSAATLYHLDGVTAFRYWNLLHRPAGSVNASANDMAAYLLFHLCRGVVAGASLIPSSDMDRIETPATTWAAKAGLKAGYGLYNVSIVRDGFVYHGHDGGLDGALTEMWYMPEHGVGYFFSLNTSNDDVDRRVDQAIRNYITRDLPRPAPPPIAALPSDADDYSGWYEPDSTDEEMTRFLTRLKDLRRVHFVEGKLVLSPVRGVAESFLPVGGGQFRRVPDGGVPEPVATLQLFTESGEGRFFAFDMVTWKRLPGWQACLEMCLAGLVLLSAASSVVYAPFWIVAEFFANLRHPAERGIRAWPLIASLGLLEMLYTLSSGLDLQTYGNLTVWSAALFLSSLVFPLATVASGIAVWHTPTEVGRRWVRWHSIIVTNALLLGLAYLLWGHVIGIRTWA